MGSPSRPHTAFQRQVFGDALEYSSIGFDIVDAAGRILYANPAYLRMWGYDRLEEVVGADAAAHCADPEVPASVIAELRERGACTREFVARRHDGSTFDVQMSIQRSVDTDGVEIFYATSLDVTERKRGERALRESQRQLRAFITQAPIAIAMFDREMRYLAVSGGWSRGFGRGYPDLIGMCHYEVHPDMPRWWREIHQRGLAGEVISADEDLWRHPDGTDQWLRWSVRPWRDDAGTIGGIIIFTEDITVGMAARLALRDSEEKFARAFRISPDAININRITDGTYLEVNEGFTRMTGYTADEVVGRSSLELDIWAEPADRARLVELLRRDGEVLNFEAQFRVKDGTLRTCLMSARVLEITGTACILSITRDISEWKRAEAALRRSEERYRSLAEAAPDAIYIIGPDDRVQYVNRAAETMLGRPRDQIVGGSRSQLFPPPVAQRHRYYIDQVLATGENVVKENPIPTPAGEIWVNTSLVPLRDDDGRVTAVLGISRDVTERRRSEATSRFLARALESVSEVVLITDLGLRITFANDAFVQVFGHGRDEVIGRDVGWLWPAGDPPPEFREMLLGERPASWRGEIAAIARDGRQFPLLVQFSQVRDNQETLIGLVGIAQDDSVRRNLETQLHQAQKMEAIGQLAGGIAHDYNNMIGGILGYATLLEEGLAPTDSKRAHLATIIGAAQRSADLTRQLLAFARRQVATPVPLDLNAAVRNVHGMLERLIGEDITLRLSLADDLWTVKLDATQADQIFTNLATNARDAIAGVGEVVFTTANVVLAERDCRGRLDWRTGEFVKITVHDSGCGMDDATLAHVFEPFFTTKPQGMGTGLGLATVFGIVKQNDGFIDVVSAPDTGTTVVIHLPRHRGEAAPRPNEAPGSRSRGTETVLVVEDEPQLLQFVCAALTRQGYRVLSASSPGEAIRTVVESPSSIDLLLTDVIMPGMNGNELRDRLVAMHPSLAVVFMSGHPAEVVARRGFVAADVDLLNKPFTIDQLCQRVRAALDG